MLHPKSLLAFAILVICFIFLESVQCVVSKQQQEASSYSTKLIPTALQPNSPKKKNEFKEPLPRAFDRSSSLQHNYAPKSEHIDVFMQPHMTDHEQKLAISARQPRSETPTKSRLPIHRQESYKEAKQLEHEHNGIAKIYQHGSKQGENSIKDKQRMDMFGEQESIRAKSFARKAKVIVENPNGPKTKWPKGSGDTSWIKGKSQGHSAKAA